MPNPDPIESEIIRAHILKTSREYLLAHPEIKLGFFKNLHFRYLLNQRSRGVPLAYLTHHKEFFGLDFFVNKHTLIPRPETELTVEAALETINELANRPDRQNPEKTKVLLIDVGTGSGCIPIVIMKTRVVSLSNPLKHESMETIATDVSRAALRVAKRNAKKHGVDITFFRGNLLAPVFRWPHIWRQDHYIVTANLPYLTKKQFIEEPSIRKEPKRALIADATDGLSLYKKLLPQLDAIQKPLGSLTIIFEINPEQAEPLTALIRNAFNRAKVEITIKKDLAGLKRLVVARLTPAHTIR